MTRKGILEQVAKEKGKTVRQLVLDTVKRRGSVLGAAKALGVSQSTISYHLAKAGYIIKHSLEKVS